MDKFTGLFIKANGEWQVHGKIDTDVDGKIELLKEITDAGGQFGKGKAFKQAERACIIHSKKGVLKTRVFK